MIEVVAEVPAIQLGRWWVWSDDGLVDGQYVPPVGLDVRFSWGNVGFEVGHRQSFGWWDVGDGTFATRGFLHASGVIRTRPSDRPAAGYALLAVGAGAGLTAIEGFVPRVDGGVNLAVEGGVAGGDGWRPRLGLRFDTNVPGGEWEVWKTERETGTVGWTWDTHDLGLRLVVGGAWGRR